MVEVSFIPKKEKKPITFGHIFFVGAVVIFFISLSIFGYLFFYQKNLDGRLQNFSNIQKNLEKKRDIDFERSVLNLNQDIKNAKVLFDSHAAPSGIFKILEVGIHPKVQIISADFDFSNKTLSISAVADNLRAFDDEQVILKKTPGVENIDISGVRLESDWKVKFNLKISLSAQYLKYGN